MYDLLRVKFFNDKRQIIGKKSDILVQAPYFYFNNL